ncbi:MAG: aminoacyl-tRNA hydrolase, partial [Chloroflexi bacterium]|nr:aminoacyl-tRNA hydrolase [Chloroflexota bacterium]
MKLIVGLGNPGPRYAQNRHNVGFQCLERIARGNGMAFGKVMFKAYVASGQIAGTKVLLAKPLTFMNLSGQAVRPLFRWYRVALQDLLVVYDDLDLATGRIRLRKKGGSGGHKGMASIIEALGSQDFARLRIGIGRPVHGEPTDYVLGNFSPDELVDMETAYDRAEAAIEAFVTDGIDVAMNRFNPPGNGYEERDNGHREPDTAQ